MKYIKCPNRAWGIDEIRRRPPLQRSGESRPAAYGARTSIRTDPGRRIYIEQINHPFLFGDKATPAEYTAGLKYAASQGWLDLHESGAFVKLTQRGADLFA